MAKKTRSMAFPSDEAQLRDRLVAELLKPGDSKTIAGRQFHDDFFRLIMLAERYDIPIGSPNVFFYLSLALARELYPEPKRAGRKKKWNELNMAALVVEIERLTNKNDPARGISWASKQIAKREPWRSFLEHKDSPGTVPDPGEVLRRTYFNFKDHEWATMAREAFAHYKSLGAENLWDEHVQSVVRISDPN